MSLCKLIIKDEVNLKIEGLSLEVRRKLVNAFKYDAYVEVPAVAALRTLAIRSPVLLSG